jgi:hypothetical protein
MTLEYDSSKETLLHIKRVNELLIDVVKEFLDRAKKHDLSKLETPEKELFDKYTPLLKNTVYGSDEYKKFLVELKPSLDHHYKNNTHHPEHYGSGVNEMNLFDILEMFVDWKAATERHANGNMINSIKINKERFKISDQLAQIFLNTVEFLEKKN